MKVHCDFCGQSFNKPPSKLKKTKNNFCSHNCHSLFQEKAIIKNCKFCKSIFYVRPTEVHKFTTCSDKVCRSKNKVGKNNPNFRHGKTKLRKKIMSTSKYKQWRQAVLDRDKNTCLFCGVKKDKGLHVDHIKPWSFFKHLRYEISNARTLCKTCHEKTYKDTFLWRDWLEPHILVDFDCTLAYYDGWTGPTTLGTPILPMVTKIKRWLFEGKKVIIFTARMTKNYPDKVLSDKELFDVEEAIKSWCEEHIGRRLLVTNEKTYYSVVIYDDRAIQVETNTGRILNNENTIKELPKLHELPLNTVKAGTAT